MPHLITFSCDADKTWLQFQMAKDPVIKPVFKKIYHMTNNLQKWFMKRGAERERKWRWTKPKNKSLNKILFKTNEFSRTLFVEKF